MDDLLSARRSGRRSLLVRLGSATFALLAVLVIADAIRGAPPLLAEGAISGREATLYRVCAAAVCIALSVLLWTAGGGRRDGGSRLLR